MEKHIFRDPVTGTITFVCDYRAPHANRGTPPRKHKKRSEVFFIKCWGLSGAGAGISKRLFR